MNGLIDLKIKLEKIEKKIGIRSKGNKKTWREKDLNSLKQEKQKIRMEIKIFDIKKQIFYWTMWII